MPAPRGVFALLSCLLITVAAGSAGTPAGLGTPSVAWPPSGGLLLAEVMTGGASASDEYVEIANAGSASADLGGCELVYVTASGSTITRKAAVTAPLLLVPGQHLLVANSAGIYGPLADATYTGGLAADGGAVVLRKTDGTVIDAVGWGTAVNSYVEGAVAPAPPARSSIERRPGGSGGNLVDTNDNGSDFLIQPNPVPQSLASRPVPGASATPSASPSDTPTALTPTELASSTAALPSPSATPSDSATPAASLASSPTSTETEAPAPTGATETETPTAQPTRPAETETPTAEPTGPAETAEPTTETETPTPTTATATGAPTAAPTATATPAPTPSPRSSAAPSSPATPGPTPRPSPTPAPTPELETIAAARLSAIGTTVHVSGVITAVPGLVGAGLFAIQDTTGGIFVRAATATEGLAEGRQVEVDGTLSAPYGQLEIRGLGELVVGADQKGWPAQPVGLSEIGEGTEGLLVAIAGTVDSVQTDNGRLTVMVSDGQSVVRVLADPPIGLSHADVARGDQIVVSGIVGQRATATGRLDGYRLWPRRRTDVAVQRPVDPTPIPTATAAPTATAGSTTTATATGAPTAAPTATATPAPTPSPRSSAAPSSPATSGPTRKLSPTPAPTPDLETIAVARLSAIGTTVHVSGVITAVPGLVGAGLFAIEDSSAGIFVRVATPTDGLTEGRQVEVDGTLAAPYGQLEIRGLGELVVGADQKGWPAQPVGLSEIGEGAEGLLVAIAGTVDSVQTDNGRLTVMVSDGRSVVRVLADPPIGLSHADVARGDQIVVSGIVGQRATATGRLDGYRLWPRRRTDVVVQRQLDPTPTPTPTTTAGSTVSPTATATPTASPTGPSQTFVYYDLASALGTRGANVDVEAVVTATAGLLDIGAPTIVVDDGSAAAAVILPAGTSAPGIGMRVRVTGKVGRWEGGPTVLAASVDAEGQLSAVTPLITSTPLDGSLEWQLVQVCGRIDRYTPAGTRWRLEMLVGGNEMVILGEPAAGITMKKDSVGRIAVVVGIVRRSTSDASAFQVLPRLALDVRLGPAPAPAPVAKGTSGVARASDGIPAVGLGAHAIEIGSAPDYLGQTVTVSGIVTETTSGTATIDDGSGAIRVGGLDAAAAIAVLAPGDAVEVTGVVSQDGEGLFIAADPDSVVDLPADGSDGSNEQASGADGAHQLTAASGSAAVASAVAPDAMRRASSAITPPGQGLAVNVLLVVTLLAGAVALGLVMLRRRPVAEAINRWARRRRNHGSQE